jgi:hypothetical protein
MADCVPNQIPPKIVGIYRKLLVQVLWKRKRMHVKAEKCMFPFNRSEELMWERNFFPISSSSAHQLVV